MKARRSLIGLGLAALFSLGLAGFALHERAQEGAPHFAPSPFLPGFAEQVKNAARIHIVSHEGVFDITNRGDKGWVLPQRGNYPADFDEVRHTLIGLAALETIAPKTARPDWFKDIGLETPPKGNGVLIEVKDGHGQTIASVIMGNMENTGDANGSAGLFVRRPGENQTWLARAVFVPHGDPAAWMALKVLEIEPARIKDIAIAPASGKPFTLSHQRPSDLHYTLSPPVKNPDNTLMDAIADAISGFAATDAKPASEVDFSKPTRVTVHGFDGLTINLELATIGSDSWARINATGAQPAASAQAQAINARAGAWAFKLAPDKAAALLTPQAKLGTP